MTYIVPDYFEQNNTPNLITSDDMFYIAYSSRKNQKRFIVRNTLNVIIIMFEGTKLLHMQNQDLKVEKNNIVFLSQGQYFMSEILGDTHSYDAALIYFDNSFIVDFIKKYNINMSTAKAKSEIVLENDKFIQNISSSFELYVKKNFENKNKIMKLKTEEILLHLYNKNPHELLHFFQHIMQAQDSTLKYKLESNLETIETIEDLCQLTKLNSTNLRKQMIKEYGQFPKEWLNEKRLNKAALLLQTTDDSVAQIATSCNYATPSWFINQFKKKYHKTPKQYRNETKTI